MHQIDSIISGRVAPPVVYGQTGVNFRRPPSNALAGVNYTAVYVPETEACDDTEVQVIDLSSRAVRPRDIANLALRELTEIEPVDTPLTTVKPNPFSTEQICEMYRVPMCVVQIGHTALTAETNYTAERSAILYHPVTVDPLTSLLAMQAALQENFPRGQSYDE